MKDVELRWPALFLARLYQIADAYVRHGETLTEAMTCAFVELYEAICDEHEQDNDVLEAAP